MSRATDPLTPSFTPPTSSPAPTPPSPKPAGGNGNGNGNGEGHEGHVCPFCGLTRDLTENFDPASPCPRCTLADTPTTRNATKARVGPWHVRQVRNPWAPGMRFDTLLALIKRGQVTRDSVVRGPTTWQLWKRASEIKGLSREFGLCYFCGAEIDTQANLCPQCNRLQEPPANPDVLVDARSEASSEPSKPPVAPLPVVAPARVALPPSSPAFDEPASIEISAPRSMGDSAELLAVTHEQEELARQITSRPPVKPPAAPVPSTNGGRAPRPTSGGGPGAAPGGGPGGVGGVGTLNLRPRQPGADDALLTPEELAAAFQLDFSPPANGNGQPRQHRPRRAAAALAVLLLFALGAAALLYLRPDLRRKGSTWCQETFATVKGFFTSRTSPTPSYTPTTRSSSGMAPGSMTPRARASEPVVIVPPPAPAPRAVAVSDAPPKQMALPAPPPVPPPAVSTAPAPPKTDTAQVATGVVKADATPAPAPAPVAPRPKKVFASISDAYDEEKRLWSKAIDAEANQDYVEAVRCYEEIKQLPREVHPPALEVRLDLAKRLVK